MSQRHLSRFMMAACIALLAGCDQKKTTAVAAPQTSGPIQTSNAHSVFFNPTNAQPKLATVKLWLGSQEVVAEVAATEIQIMTGMMFRKEMGENEGMIFVFPRPHRTSFYMRNTYVPLTCAYIDSEGTILELHDMKPLDETAIPAATDNIQYVLEMKQGWFNRNNISIGTVVRSDGVSLRETFFRRRR
jgi:hypothetical protein